MDQSTVAIDTTGNTDSNCYILDRHEYAGQKGTDRVHDGEKDRY